MSAFTDAIARLLQYNNGAWDVTGNPYGMDNNGHVHNFVQACSDVATVGQVVGGRENLTANRTYYVRADGSNSNTGLVNSSGGAFLTLQKAVDIVANELDLAGYTVTIQVGAGTYTGGVSRSGAFVGNGLVQILGDTTTPSNVLVSVTSANGFAAYNGARFNVAGFKITTTTGGSCLYADTGAEISFYSCDFGACASSQIEATNGGGAIRSLGDYKISGGGVSHWHVHNGEISVGNNTITITGTPAFSSYFAGVAQGRIECPSITFSGSATGPRFLCHLFGSIYTGSYSLTYLPGNAAGTVADGGFYDGVSNVGIAAIGGTTTNDNAAAGYVGELIRSDVVIGSATALTTSTPKNITSISLTAGDWDVWATAGYTGGVTTTVSIALASISSVSTTVDSNSAESYATAIPMGAAVFSQQSLVFGVGPVRKSLASTTTIYLVSNQVFGTSTMSGFGTLQARRRR